MTADAIPLVDPTWHALVKALEQRHPVLSVVRGGHLADGDVHRLWAMQGAPHVLLGDGPTARALVERVKAELPHVEVRGA